MVQNKDGPSKSWPPQGMATEILFFSSETADQNSKLYVEMVTWQSSSEIGAVIEAVKWRNLLRLSKLIISSLKPQIRI